MIYGADIYPYSGASDHAKPLDIAGIKAAAHKEGGKVFYLSVTPKAESCLIDRYVLVACCAMRYLQDVIKSFRHKGLKRYFESGSKAGIQQKHANRLRIQLVALDTAIAIEDMDVPGFNLHPLKGSNKNRWSIWVSGNWRLTFEFHDGNAYLLNYEVYH